MRFAPIAAALIALPAFAQTADPVDASGAMSSRHPHKAMRQADAKPSCKQVHLPSGKLPTYGNPALDPRCQPVTIAQADGSKDVAKD